MLKLNFWISIQSSNDNRYKSSIVHKGKSSMSIVTNSTWHGIHTIHVRLEQPNVRVISLFWLSTYSLTINWPFFFETVLNCTVRERARDTDAMWQRTRRYNYPIFLTDLRTRSGSFIFISPFPITLLWLITI